MSISNINIIGPKIMILKKLAQVIKVVSFGHTANKKIAHISNTLFGTRFTLKFAKKFTTALMKG